MLTEITPTESVMANQVAQRIVTEIVNLSKRIVVIRTEGIPAIAASARPARPAMAAISADAINAALGKDNCDLLDSIKASIL